MLCRFNEVTLNIPVAGEHPYLPWTLRGNVSDQMNSISLNNLSLSACDEAASAGPISFATRTTASCRAGSISFVNNRYCSSSKPDGDLSFLQHSAQATWELNGNFSLDNGTSDKYSSDTSHVHDSVLPLE